MDKIKTALLSFGMSGEFFHTPFITLHQGFELTGSWERTTKKIQEKYPNTTSYPTLESILEDKSIMLVIVNTPVATHYEYTKKVLLAGKHVIVEKAFTTTVAEALELAALAKKRNLKLAVFQNRRWDSDFKTVREIFLSNILGDIIEAEFHFDRYNPNLSPKKHKETQNAGAGILKDLGSHIIDQALYLFGFPNAVMGDIRITRANSQVDDWIDISLYYSNLRVRLKASFFVREPYPAYVLHGKKGSFLKVRGDIQEDELKMNKKPNTELWGTETINNQGTLHTELENKIINKKIPTINGNYYHFFDEMYYAIKNNLIEPVTAQEGIQTMQIIEAVIESHKQQKIVKL